MPTLSAVRAFGATLPKSLSAALLGACRSLKERRNRRAAVAPDRIDDRLLRDIGVSRSDLMAAERLKKPHRRNEGR
ncbi:DUF1127 domain-containing protein [Azospirillum sp. YIM DDC1]|uniref:DUF1127 domain-containing protein n=1 Tax=Azospirillum aestuarii TaxID=2802052 RepID=A0ABS1I7L9_9PROT|nr:DUF1127 domain-containing protein [Azospirillum aestuarii]MBK3773969.1 DUF1127 domain-containing protein [Azospirillum brasilense]MBK4722678.1 DUF1127 domain-containing protein [Azospirillum aestuarii]TWA84538.1 uncharacterized protein DUF1127 [Azospirillum brasilense]